MTTRTGVSVYTWGNEQYSSDPMEYNSGMSHFAKSSLLGGNVGHASILLTLPNTEENRQMVDTYLKGTHIPVETRKYETKEAAIVDGKAVKTNKTIYEESVIEVYFSWWPHADVHGFTFNTFREDCIEERKGVEANYSKEWVKYLDPEVRKVSSGIKSFLPDSTISLRPAHIMHDRGNSPEEQKLLHLAHLSKYVNSLYNSGQHLIKKLDGQISAGRTSPKLSIADEAILKRMFPDQEVSITEAKSLNAQVLKRLNDISDQLGILKLDSIHARAELKPPVVALTEDETQIYEKIQKYRILYKYFGKVDSLGPYEKKQINDILDNLFPSQFPGGVTNENWLDIMLLVQPNCDSKNEEGLYYLHKDIIEKGDVLQVYECINGINNAKELLANIEAYETASEVDKEAAKDAIIAAVDKIPVLKILFNNSEALFKEEHITTIKRLANNLLLPSKNSFFYKKFNEVMNYHGNDFDTFLVNDNIKLILNENMSEGHRPSHTVEIPLRSESVNGLDPKEMLQQMALFANQGSAFNIVNNNCSVTTSAILARGAQEHGWVFEQGAYGNSIANPQMVHNNAMQFVSTKKEDLVPPVVSWYASTQNYFAGLSVRHAAELSEPKKSHLATLGNVIGALSSGIFASAMMFVNALGESSEAHFEDLMPIPKAASKTLDKEDESITTTLEYDDPDPSADAASSYSSNDSRKEQRRSLTWATPKEEVASLPLPASDKLTDKTELESTEKNVILKK